MTKLYTIGHSNHSLSDFIKLLHNHKISHLVDVRSIPKSHHVPWFNEKSLRTALRKEKISYTHLPSLGGLRHTCKNSINQAWINASFRGYADYMQSSEFYEGLKELNQLIKGKNKVAVMCAEAVPWRCHRSMIADAETIRGIKVFHIMNQTNARAHHLTSFAVVDKSKRPMKLYYPK